jgi:hypothetical protein
MLDFFWTVPGLIVLAVIGLVIGGVFAAWKTLREPDPNPKPKNIQVNSGLVATLAALGFLAFQVPSISIDLSTIFSYASQIVTMMMPIVGVGAGISFGFALVAYIIRLFRQIF